MGNEIKLADNDSTIAIVKLLNAVTLSLHTKGINQWTYPWELKEIGRDIKNRNTYKMTIDNLIVGTFSIKEVDVNKWVPINKSNNLYLYRIAILPEYQGKNIGLKIIKYACMISLDFNKTLYLDCWTGSEKLKDFYLKAGFNFCGDFPEEDYMISVFKYG